MAQHYQHILLATDLLDDNQIVAQKALQLAKLCQARLSAIHVVESIPLYFGNELVLPETQEIELQLVNRANEKMTQLAKQLSLSDSDCHVEVGATKFSILEFAEQHNVDLIVIGSHSRHGLERLLGSTANAVLHGANCDVMAVRIDA